MAKPDDQPEPAHTAEPFRLLLKRLRLRLDHTQESLAERANVSARLISDLERGTIQRPRRETVRLLADAFDLTGPDRDAFVHTARGRGSTPPEPPPHRPAIQAAGLPQPPTPIIGRVKDAATATTLLMQTGVRCLTFTGPGGVGKTRLALAVAADIAGGYRDGSAFVDLAPLQDPDLVIPAVARALGVREAGDSPLGERLVSALQPVQLLLVLDNVEHLTPAAPQIAALLAACPGLTVLATGRTPLRIRAERELRIEPLALPDPTCLPLADELARVAAVELFVQRAESADRHFALTPENAADIAAITVRLDGLPLAIELAAARVKVLSPAAILARLDSRLALLSDGPRDLPDRHHAMRSTIAWSYDLLPSVEQHLFERLSVFSGGCSLAAIHAVSREVGKSRSREDDDSLLDSSTPRLLDSVGALIDKSLLRRVHDTGDDPRFGMLETIREYGQERLAASGSEPDARRAQAIWCLELAERAEPELIGTDQEVWFARLTTEHDNIRAALQWAVATGEADIALRLCGALYRFWATGGQYQEGERWLAAALPLASHVSAEVHGNALLGAGVMSYFRGAYPKAEHHWSGALARFDSVQAVRGIAYSYGNLGLVADAQANYDRAVASYESALARFRELEDQTYIGFMLNNLALIAYFQGRLDEAASLASESLVIARHRAAPDSIAYCLGNLGLVEFARGNYAHATTLQVEALTIRRHLTNHVALARGLENFALLAAAQHHPERAARLFAAAHRHRETVGSSLPPNDIEINERYIAIARNQLGADAFALNWAEGEDLEIADAIALALAPAMHPSASSDRVVARAD